MVANPPDVLIISLHYLPDPTGVAPYTGALGAGLVNRGYQVKVYGTHPHYPEWKIREGYGGWSSTEMRDGVEVHRLLHYVPAEPRGIRRLISELSFALRLVFRRIGHPRLVIAVSPSLLSSAVAVLRLRLIPSRPRLAVWVQDIYTLGLTEIGEGGGFVQRIMRWVESRTLGAADVVVVIHDRFREYVTTELGVPVEKVVVLRNWTHLPRLEPVESDTAKAQLGWPDDGTLAVHAGNMGAKQGLKNIIDAARLADERGADVRFLLVGDGGERRALEELAHGISRLKFVDPLDDDDYRLALAAADVLIVNEKPGVASMAVPSKLTSYFAAGRPVVAATAPGGITASEVTAAGAGVVVPAGDPEALLRAVIAMGGDRDASARYGLSGRTYRESVLDQDAAIQRWVGLIETTNEAATPGNP